MRALLLAGWLLVGWAFPAGVKAEEGKAKDFEATMTITPSPLARGSEGELVLSVAPLREWVLKVETPFEAKLTASPGVVPAKTTLSAKDFLDPKAQSKQIKVTLRGEAAGEQSVGAELSFFLCTSQICRRFQTKLESRVKVQ